MLRVTSRRRRSWHRETVGATKCASATDFSSRVGGWARRRWSAAASSVRAGGGIAPPGRDLAILEAHRRYKNTRSNDRAGAANHLRRPDGVGVHQPRLGVTLVAARKSLWTALGPFHKVAVRQSDRRKSRPA